ncbi:hypothetical protein D3C86_1934340 [compost metagenome]
MLEALSQYFRKAKLLGNQELKLIAALQAKRNAIHAFMDRDIGTMKEFHDAVAAYQRLLDGLSSRLPYPFEH